MLNDDMDLETFKISTKREEPPEGLSVALEAMWYQSKGNWDEAHRLAQSESSPNARWVHAHLHRVEGDIGSIDEKSFRASPRLRW